jgi:hypothetical protein
MCVDAALRHHDYEDTCEGRRSITSGKLSDSKHLAQSKQALEVVSTRVVAAESEAMEESFEMKFERDREVSQESQRQLLRPQ